MPAKNYASTRFSTLTEINTENVKNLKLAWTFSTGLTRGHEAAPLVVNNTMYIVTPWPNILYALDLTKPGAPVKWSYKPQPSPASQGVACCDVVNRGAAYYNGRIYYNTLDVHTVAVDAATGKEVWKTKLGDINKGESMTMAPLVVERRGARRQQRRRVRGSRLAGRPGRETGKILWRAYGDGPGQRRSDRPEFQAVLCAGPRDRPWREDLAGRAMEDRRRHGLELDLLRSRSRSDLLRNLQRRALERGPAAG